jgi:hypothetical protein
VLQGTLVMIPLLPYGLAHHIYGPDALEFKPQRWMTPADSSTAAASSAPAGAEAAGKAAGSASALPPEPLTFLTGQRDW